MHARGVSRDPTESTTAEAATTVVGDGDQQEEQQPTSSATGSIGAPTDADVPSAASPDSSSAAAAPFRPRSVGSVVMGLVGRAPPRSGPSGEEEEGVEGEEDSEEASDAVDAGDGDAGENNAADADSSSGPKNSPTFNLPAHSASRTRCPLCENAFDLTTHLPILLHAGHTFCNFCMSSSNALAPVGNSVTCPVCKLTVEVPLDTGAKEAFKSELKARAKLQQQSQSENGGDNNTSTASTANEANVPLSPFPVNFLIRDSLELTNFIDDIRSNNIVCDKCDDKAIGKCLVCDMTLCEFHVQDHKKSKETRNHSLQDFAEFLSALPSPNGGAADPNTSTTSASPLAASFLSSNQKSIMRQKQYCQHHPDMELDLFCLECNIPICQKCTLPSGGTIHSGNSSGSVLPHPTEQLKSASLRSFNELQHLNEQTKTKYTNIIKGMVEIQKVAQKIQAREQKVASQIVGYFDALHQILEARKLKLLTRLSELVSSKNYTLNLQNQILYIVARALEDASMEVDSMLDAVVAGSSSDFDTILRKEIDPRTNANGPDSTVIAPQPFHSVLASPNSSGVNVSLASIKSTNTTIDTSLSNPIAAVTPTSLSSKLLHVQGHLSANLEALLKFQPVALHPEDSDQFSFVVTNPPASANIGKVQSSPTSALNSSSTTPRASPTLQKSYSEDSTSFLDERVLQSISKTGIVGDSMAIASLCTASGEGLTSCFVRSESRFQIQARDRFNQPKTRGGDPFVVEFIGPKGSASGRVMDHQNGTYTVRYMVLQPGSYSVIVSIHGRHIAGSPFRVTVQGAKDGLLSIGREWLTSVGSRGTSPSQFMNPMGIAISTDAHLFVADYGNNRLSVYKAMSGGLNFPYLRSIGKSGSENAALKNPWSLAFDPITNNLYVSDTGNHRIQVFTSATGEWVRSWGAVGSGAGKFRTPAGIAIYTPLLGNVNFSDDGSSTASAANAGGDKNAPAAASADATSADAQVAGSPVAASSLSTSIAASLTPHQLSIQREQLVFVSDREKNRIQVFDMSGRFIRLFGSSGSGPSQFLHPSGLALDPRRQILYVADFSNHRIQAFNLKGEFLRMWGVRGNLPGQFLDPVGVSVDRTGLVYVSEQSNQRVQVFAPDGTFLRMLGTSGSGGGGSNSKGSFQKPTAIAIASFKADGNVLQLHEDAGDENAVAIATSSEDASTSGSVETAHKGVITHTLVFVSDAANHKVHVFQ